MGVLWTTYLKNLYTNPNETVPQKMKEEHAVGLGTNILGTSNTTLPSKITFPIKVIMFHNFLLKTTEKNIICRNRYLQQLSGIVVVTMQDANTVAIII